MFNIYVTLTVINIHKFQNNFENKIKIVLEFMEKLFVYILFYKLTTFRRPVKRSLDFCAISSNILYFNIPLKMFNFQNHVYPLTDKPRRGPSIAADPSEVSKLSCYRIPSQLPRRWYEYF